MTDYFEPIRAQQSWREPTESPYESLAGLMDGIPRLAGALCRGLSAVFDVEDAADPRAERAAEMCARCPALQPCAAWLETLPPRQRPAGVVAGQLPPTAPKKRLRVPSPAAVENVAVRGDRADQPHEETA